MNDDKTGWWSVKAFETWKCPECLETTPVDDWQETETYCEDCGSHDARRCPKCGETFDHVWGSSKIAAAQQLS